MAAASARAVAAVGVHLQQAVAALFQLRFQLIVLLAAAVDEFVEAFLFGRRGQIADQLLVAAVVDGAAGRAGVFEGIQPLVEPAAQHRLRGVLG